MDPAAEYMNKGLGKIDASHVRKELSDSGYKKMYNRIKSNYSDVAKMSSASKNINVYRNDQNRDIINLVSDNVFNKYQQIQIKECIRSFNIDLTHFIKFKKLFMACDEDQDGYIMMRDLINEIHS